jgi:hypothetical protein
MDQKKEIEALEVSVVEKQCKALLMNLSLKSQFRVLNRLLRTTKAEARKPPQPDPRQEALPGFMADDQEGNDDH